VRERQVTSRRELEKLRRLRSMWELPSINRVRAMIESSVREFMAAAAAEEWKPLFGDENPK
jgi:hypothetical protein